MFSVDAKMVDVETGIIIATAIYDYQGDIGEMMIQGMKEIAKQLSGIEQFEAVSQKIKSPVIVQKKPPLQERSVETSTLKDKDEVFETALTKPPPEKDEGEVLETVITRPPTKKEDDEEITEFVNTGYTVGVLSSYPLWMSAGLADGKASPVFGAVVSTPFGVAVGPIKMSVGANLGIFDFSDIQEHSGVILITTLNIAIMETPEGAISAEVGGGYYGASLGGTAGLKYSYIINGVPLILEPYLRFNWTFDSGSSNDLGSVAWFNAGMFLSYDLGSLF
mgnify:CR=1 FL=1